MLRAVKKLRAFEAAAAVLAVALGTAALTACSRPTELADELAVNMGNASPIESPSATDPDGEVHEYEPVLDLDTTDGLIAVRTADAITVGALDEILDETAESWPLEAECGDVSANAGVFAVGCGTTVRTFTASGADELPVEHPATSATVTSSGEILAGSSEERDVWVYRDGELVKTIPVARETDSIQAVPVDGQPDTVVRTNSFDTTIQDLDWNGGRQGGTLRVGLGVGKTAGGEQGLVLAADTTGNQLLVYTSDDIIRLHQMAPVPESPWDVSWDPANRLVWVASTSQNLVTGYDISRGVPLQRAQLRTVANAQSIISLDDGTLVLASATGDGIQIITPAQKDLRDLPTSDR
ncbi:hypothetical protein CGLAU_06475 [Corynebacterium glaucum]|uniref:Uncharacterized protein n=1 Tax=Corynebacterium glaucum TaxID=187491 RepID=A0A1Q2HWN8_9CORY|nr:hypothetical protein CGLAU_06475 [Corynebacterium glaucum]